MMDDIKEMANYCLNCKTKPCSIKGCPINTDIPEFINEIKNENYPKAYDILAQKNICSYICSIVCPQEEQCEGSCIRGIKSKPTEIGKLEKYVNEWAKNSNYEYKTIKKENNGKKVAIIGSGPAGLECAYELLKNGFSVDIYEKDKIPGGILIYGIPDFRLPKDIVNDVINNLEKLGAKFYTEKKLGIDLDLKELKEKYDYIFLGIGAAKSSVYSLSNENLSGIYESDVFLRLYHDRNFIEDLGTVVVIGGGNVAMDCARTAIRMGANKVKILYRRDRKHMPALERELEEAIEDGVEFHELTRVVSANTFNIEKSSDALLNVGNEKKKIKSLNCIKTKIVDGKAVDIDGEEFEEDANTVIFAIGLKPDKDFIEKQGLELDEWEYIKVDENGKTSIENVYAGGDITESKATVCRALAAGKRAAKGIIGA